MASTEATPNPSLVPRSQHHLVPLLAALCHPDASPHARRQLAVQLVEGSNHNPEIRTALSQELLHRSAQCTTIAECRRFGPVVAALALNGGHDFVLPMVCNQEDPTIAVAAIQEVQRVGELKHVELLVQLGLSSPEPHFRWWAFGCAASITVNPARLKPTIINMVREAHQSDSDPGVHGMAELLLMRWNHMDSVRRNRDRLREMQSQRSQFAGDRLWFVGPLRATMMAVSDDPSGRQPSFAMSLHEVSQQQYEEFMRAHPEYAPVEVKRTGEPARRIPIHHARAFCHELSRIEGLEHCYQIDKQTETYQPIPGWLTKTGYRLPTIEEWKIACFSAARTSYPFGRDEDAFTLFANSSISGTSMVRYVCRSLPNRYGLFDMIGNVGEMCEDPATGNVFVCGGSWSEPPNSPDKEFNTDSGLDTYTGFRVVKSLR